MGLIFFAYAIKLAGIGNSLDHRLHSITMIGLTLGVLGSLYLSYELLDRKYGLLRRLLQIVTPGLVMALPWLILTFACFILAFILQIAVFLSSFFTYVGYFFAIVATIFGMIGLLSGIFIEHEIITEETIMEIIMAEVIMDMKNVVTDDKVGRKEYKIIKLRTEGKRVEARISKDNKIEIRKDGKKIEV